MLAREGAALATADRQWGLGLATGQTGTCSAGTGTQPVQLQRRLSPAIY